MAKEQKYILVAPALGLPAGVVIDGPGAEVLALTYRDNQKILSVADDLLFIPRGDPLFSAAVEILPLQLLAYYVAKENGCDIDKPKNLAKSVTVE